MKINPVVNSIETNISAEEKEFSIAANAHMFQLLSEKLYSDKARAIIRELAANALDSHIEAGQTKPFELEFPSILRPYFVVRDFGVGLSAEDIENLYTTYGETSKGGTNRLTGGLGLGSKTPFAYTDTFTVRSVFNKEELIYTAYIGEHGAPKIRQISRKSTFESNGITITVPISHRDISNFCAKAQFALRYFPQGSFKVFGIPDIRFVEYDTKHAEYGIRKTDAHANSTVRIVMGPVGYKLVWESLPEDLKKKFYRLRRYPIDMFVAIGQCDIAPSRETLSYTKKTLNVLERIFEKVAKEVTKDLEKQVLDLALPIERYWKVRQLNDKWDELFDDTQFRPIVTSLQTSIAWDHISYLSNINHKRPKLLPFERFMSPHFQLRVLPEIRLLTFDSNTTFVVARAKQFAIQSRTYKCLIVNKDRVDPKLLMHLFGFKLDQFIDLNSIVLPKTTTTRISSSNGKPKGALLEVTHLFAHRNSGNFQNCFVDFSKLKDSDFWWCRVSNHKIMDLSYDILTSISAIKAAFPFLVDVPIYGVPRSEQRIEKHLPQSRNLAALSTYLHAQLQQSAKVRNVFAARIVYQTYALNTVREVCQQVAWQRSFDKRTKFGQLVLEITSRWNCVARYVQQYPVDALFKIPKLEPFLPSNESISTRAYDLQEAITAIVREFPLLSVVTPAKYQWDDAFRITSTNDFVSYLQQN